METGTQALTFYGVAGEEAPQLARSEASNIYRKLSDPLTAIKEMGQMFAGSGMFGCTKVEQGQVLALACMIEGKSPFELMRNYHIIGGNLSMRSSAILAEFQRRGGVARWHSKLNDGDEAKADFAMGDNTLSDASYTIEDAKREGLVGGSNPNWKTRPADMLRARLITKAIRMIAPGIVMGIMDESESAPTPMAAAEVAAPLLFKAEDRGKFNLEASLIIDDISLDTVNLFLINRGLIKEGQTFRDLPAAAIKRIEKNYLDFVEKVRAFKPE